MASQDYISQFSQGIPPTQPDRSPSRTPRRDFSTTPYETSVPAFRGPLHMATTHYRNPNFGYTHTWTPPRLPLTPSSTPPPSMHWPHMQHQGYPTQPLFPPMPPTPSPPPPPPQGSMTPQRFTTTSPKSHPFTPPPSMSQIRKGYPVRPCEIPAMPHWKPDVDFHDIGKVNGIDFPATVRSSKFSQYKDIEGMDPLQIPLWKFLYQGLNNTWLRRIAHGRDVFVLPLDNIGTTAFIAELSWCNNSRLETWTWTVWPLFDADNKAFISSKRRRHSTWPKSSPNSCNLGFLLRLLPIRPTTHLGPQSPTCNPERSTIH